MPADFKARLEELVNAEVVADLRSCYTSARRVAGELGAQTLAFPLISAGIYGWPADDAVRQALSVLGAAESSGVREARLVPFGRSMHEIAERVRAEL